MKSSILLSVALLILASQPALAIDPHKKPDDSWISISGTVASPTPDSFKLDYGDGVITVEMDDWDAYGDAYGLMDGDRVTVYGVIDDDLYEKTTIEAESVYVENLNTYFYASSSDEEATLLWTAPTPVIVNTTIVRGTVSSVSPAVGEFTINIGDEKLTVDTNSMNYNPLDDVGYQQVDVGDKVSATGTLTRVFFNERELEATSVITLSDNDSKK